MRLRPLLAGVFATLAISMALPGCVHDVQVPPAQPPARAVDGETPEQAAHRVFEVARKDAMAGTFHPEILRVATIGPPQAVSEDYYRPVQVPAPWVLPHDAESARTGMFKAMVPGRMSDRQYIVPILKDGHSVSYFGLWLDETGRWSGSIDLTDPDAGGITSDIEQATANLRSTLGAATEVRTVMFLPSGLVFAVGSNGTQEAAAYLTDNNYGPGIDGFNKYLPQTGQVFTSTELQELFGRGTTLPLRAVLTIIAIVGLATSFAVSRRLVGTDRDPMGNAGQTEGAVRAFRVAAAVLGTAAVCVAFVWTLFTPQPLGTFEFVATAGIGVVAALLGLVWLVLSQRLARKAARDVWLSPREQRFWTRYHRVLFVLLSLVTTFLGVFAAGLGLLVFISTHYM